MEIKKKRVIGNRELKKVLLTEHNYYMNKENALWMIKFEKCFK